MSDDQISIHIDASEKREDVPEQGSTGGICPRCGGLLEQGFGLAGGGFGVYEYCPTCAQVVTKTLVEE